MGYDLADEPYLVLDIKSYLKQFAHSYRTYEEVQLQDVLALQDAAELARSRRDLVRDTWKGLNDLPVKEDYETVGDMGGIEGLVCWGVKMKQ